MARRLIDEVRDSMEVVGWEGLGYLRVFRHCKPCSFYSEQAEAVGEF